jgi:tRNA (mo5U34)-methyltransferase
MPALLATTSPHLFSSAIKPEEIVINFGLMYINPVDALRRCREMTKRLLLIETQCTIVDLEDAIDSGHHSASNFMRRYWEVFSRNPEN